MDKRISVPALSRVLGVSLPRVHRLLDAVGVPSAGGRGHARPADLAVATRLVNRIGAVPLAVAGFDRVDLLVLATVSRAALGLESARAVARVAGISPTTASASLHRLQGLGLVERRGRGIVQGGVRAVRLWIADLCQPTWTADILAAVREVRLPSGTHRGSADARRVPPRFAHLFWNAPLRDMDVASNANYVASRLLQSDDVDAWVWAARRLPVESLRRAARGRGVTERRKALIHNLIAAERTD
jgi:DNA-binding Lrp family transcriptional regulator